MQGCRICDRTVSIGGMRAPTPASAEPSLLHVDSAARTVFGSRSVDGHGEVSFLVFCAMSPKKRRELPSSELRVAVSFIGDNMVLFLSWTAAFLSCGVYQLQSTAAEPLSIYLFLLRLGRPRQPGFAPLSRRSCSVLSLLQSSLFYDGLNRGSIRREGLRCLPDRP